MSTIIVNFYSRTYGDTVANMLAGQNDIPRNNDGTIVSRLPAFLKLPAFYNPSQFEFQHSWYKKAKEISNILPAHRQNNFNFNLLDPDSVVISIVPDLLDHVVRRVIAIDTWEEKHPILRKFLPKLSIEEKIKFTRKTMERWAEENILDSDIKIPLSDLSQLKNLNLGLNYNQDIINGVYNDMKKYAN